jgi:AmpE protein
MALERVTSKTKELHITTWMSYYFTELERLKFFSASSSMLNNIVVAACLSVLVWLLNAYLPGILVFLLHLLLVWVCLGCPVTRKTYKRYLQAANREDFEACYLYSTSFGNEGSDLSHVGQQLVLVNYRQYASVIIFYVLLGLPGMVFYSVVKEMVVFRQREQKTNKQTQADQSHDTNEQAGLLASEKLLFILDWLPARITSFGYLLVGHFGKGLPIWLEGLFNSTLSTYDLLAKVATASEEAPITDNPSLNEPLQLVKLVKRNIIFLLMLISLMTLVGLVA